MLTLFRFPTTRKNTEIRRNTEHLAKESIYSLGCAILEKLTSRPLEYTFSNHIDSLESKKIHLETISEPTYIENQLRYYVLDLNNAEQTGTVTLEFEKEEIIQNIQKQLSSPRQKDKKDKKDIILSFDVLNSLLKQIGANGHIHKFVNVNGVLNSVSIHPNPLKDLLIEKIENALKSHTPSSLTDEQISFLKDQIVNHIMKSLLLNDTTINLQENRYGLRKYSEAQITAFEEKLSRRPDDTRIDLYTDDNDEAKDITTALNDHLVQALRNIDISEIVKQALSKKRPQSSETTAKRSRPSEATAEQPESKRRPGL